MRRTVTLRTTLHALLAAPVLFTALPAVAEESPLVISIVTGLAPDDMLNVRATASPIGRLQARLPNGSSVKNLGCNDVNGHQWCKVEDVDNPKVSGWAPARYLIPTNPAPVADAAPLADPVASPAVAADKPAEPAGSTPSAPQAVATASDGAPPSAEPASPSAEAALPSPVPQQPAPPLDLAARLGSADHPAETAVNSAAAIGRAAMQDAYGLAFAAKDNHAAAEIPPDPAVQQPAQAQGPTQTEDGQKTGGQAPDAPAADATPTATAANDPTDDAAAPVTSAIPVPTPRPELAGAAQATNPKTVDPQAIDPQTVARVEPPTGPARAPDATGEVPCARYVGQPMTRCEASIVRMGNNKADVTVTWPDGGTRVISFYAGMPAGSNSRSDFRYTREGSLSMIRVGVSERFEITDSLAFGD